MEPTKETYDFNDNSQSNYQLFIEQKARDFDSRIMRSLSSILTRSVDNMQRAHQIRERRQKSRFDLGEQFNGFCRRLVMRDVFRNLYF